MHRGERYKKLAKTQGYTIADISRKTEIPYTTIASMIDRNFKNASIDNVLILAQAINVSIDDFIFEHNTSNRNLKVIPFKNLKKTFHDDTLNQSVTIEIVEQIFSLLDTTLKIIFNGEIFVISKVEERYLMPFGKEIYLLESQLNIYQSIINEMELQNIKF